MFGVAAGLALRGYTPVSYTHLLTHKAAAAAVAAYH